LSYSSIFVHSFLIANFNTLSCNWQCEDYLSLNSKDVQQFPGQYSKVFQ
jgi:hypothetical protein